MGIVAAFALVAASFLAGSIPSAYIVTKVALGKDIRAIGSGNPGATNVFRALGPRFAIPVFIFDFLKGFVPAFFAQKCGVSFAVPTDWLAIGAGVAAILGHAFTPFLGGKGGKGAATGAGVVAAIYPPLVPACAAVFLAVLALSRRMSLASIAAAVAAPVAYAATALATGSTVDPVFALFFALVALIVVARHRRNIRRLREGIEPALF